MLAREGRKLRALVLLSFFVQLLSFVQEGKIFTE